MFGASLYHHLNIFSAMQESEKDKAEGSCKEFIELKNKHSKFCNLNVGSGNQKRDALTFALKGIFILLLEHFFSLLFIRIWCQSCCCVSGVRNGISGQNLLIWVKTIDIVYEYRTKQ